MRQEDVADLAIAISELPDQHSAIFWRSPNLGIWCLQFGGRIESSPVGDENFAWAIPPDMHAFEIRQIRELCDLISQAVSITNAPHYSFAPSRGSLFYGIGVDVYFVAGHGATGLTCATFVLAILNCLENYELIDLDTWPPATSADIAERSKLIARVSGIWDVTQLVAEINSPRPMPSHLVGACLFGNSRVDYERADNAATLVRSNLHDYYVRSGLKL
jgi:hypothetical protein